MTISSALYTAIRHIVGIRANGRRVSADEARKARHDGQASASVAPVRLIR